MDQDDVGHPIKANEPFSYQIRKPLCVRFDVVINEIAFKCVFAIYFLLIIKCKMIKMIPEYS